MKTTPAKRFPTVLRFHFLIPAFLSLACQQAGNERSAPAVTAAAVTAAAPTAAAAAQQGAPEKRRARLFVTNYRDDTLSVVDLETEREVKVIPMPESPEGLAIRSTPPLLAIANSTAAYITLLDPVSLEVLGTIPSGLGPDDLVFSHDGKLLYVTSSRERTVYVLDVEKRSTVEVMPKFEGLPVRLEISPDGARLYVLAKSVAGEVIAVDAATRKILGRAPAGKNPLDLGISSDGKWIVTAGWDKSEISVIDTATMTVVRTFQGGTGFGLLLHPTKPIAYSMASFDDEVDVLDYEKGESKAVLSFGNYPTFSTISPDGKYLYVVHEESDNVAVVDTETNQQILRIAVGDEPSEGIYFDLP